MTQPRLLLIDGFNLLSRGYFATSYGKSDEQLSTNSEGLYTNALRVFFQKLMNLITEHDITHVAVAWDVKREDSVRRQYAPTYKETRNELPAPLIQQYETCTRLLEKIGIMQLTVPPYEADDAIGAIACQWSKRNDGHCFIYSNDRDLLQLLDERTTQIIASKKGEILYTHKHFQEEYGITPTQWIDVKALLGDKSDNIPGCPGVGEKSALPLIQQYGSVEGVYEQLDKEEFDPAYKRYQKKLIVGRESSMMSKKLSTIICDIPELVDTDFTSYAYMMNHNLVEEAFQEIELRIKLHTKLL